jgi:hypothetical protein
MKKKEKRMHRFRRLEMMEAVFEMMENEEVVKMM